MEENKPWVNSEESEKNDVRVEGKRTPNPFLSDFADDTSLFEFESFEVEDIAKTSVSENAGETKPEEVEDSDEYTEEKSVDETETDSYQEESFDNAQSDSPEEDFVETEADVYKESFAETESYNYQDETFDETESYKEEIFDETEADNYKEEVFDEAEDSYQDEIFDETETDNYQDKGFDDAEAEGYQERNLDISDNDSDSKQLRENLDAEIWDAEGRAAALAKERFIEHCRTLTLPPVKSVKDSSQDFVSLNNKAKKQFTSSGYRYENAERAPLFSDGLYGGKDKESYIEREKNYCAERKIRREIALRERTRASYRAVWYTAALLFTVFAIEILNALLPERTVLFASIEIALVLVGAALVYKALLDGIKCVFKGVFIPETLAFFSVLLSVAYGFMTLFYPIARDTGILVGSFGAINIFLTALYRYFMAVREKRVFDISSDYAQYSTEVRLADYKASPEERAFGSYASPNTSLYKINRVSRIDSGYNMQPVRDECYGLIRILFLCIVCAALASGIIFGFVNKQPYYGIFSAYMLVSLATPTGVFLSMSLPRFVTAREAADAGAAVTDFDDESDEFDENVIMLYDEDIFPPEKRQVLAFDICSSSPLIETHFARAAAVMRKIGGPLSGLLQNMESANVTSDSVVITEIEENGITATVDGAVIKIGSDRYLEKQGIEIDRYSGTLSRNTRALYIADNGEFFTRIVIKFNADAELCRKIAEFRSSETLFSVKTCTPCVDSALLFYTTGLEPELVKVIRYLKDDELLPTETDREGIFVSKTGAKGLLTALLGYNRQKKLIFIGSRITALSCLLGAGVALMISAFGLNHKFVFGIVLGFHTAVSLVSAFVGCLGISGKKAKKHK